MDLADRLTRAFGVERGGVIERKWDPDTWPTHIISISCTRVRALGAFEAFFSTAQPESGCRVVALRAS